MKIGKKGRARREGVNGYTLRLPATGALLAGGLGSRLGGRVKALLRVEDEALVDRNLRFLALLCDETLLLPGPHRLATTARAIPDGLSDRGPPGALLGALEAASYPVVFALAVDLPHPSGQAARALWDELSRGGAQAAVYLRAGRPEPLFGLYARACAAPFRRRLERGSASFAELLGLVRASLVPLSMAPEGDRDGHFLDGVNTPDDARRLGVQGLEP